MKVREILTKYNVLRQREYNSWTGDEAVKKYKEEIYSAHSQDAVLLMSNLDTTVEQYHMLGPFAVFAFKIRGPDMAIYTINLLTQKAFSSFQVQRIQTKHTEGTKDFDKAMEMLKNNKIEHYESDYFMTWQTLRLCGGKK